MRTSEQSPKGVNGLSTLFEESEQLTPRPSSRCAAVTPAPHVGVVAPSHEEEIGRRQHGAGDTGLRHAVRHARQMFGARGRELGDVADRDPPAIAEAIGEPAHLIEVEFVRALAEVEVHVDIDIELASHREHAVDLAGGIAVRIGGGADDAGAAFQRLHHQLVGARIVEQPLLRKDADLQVDRPAVGLDQRQHAVEAPHADAGVDLQVGAHVGRALGDAGIEHAACALRSRRPP